MASPSDGDFPNATAVKNSESKILRGRLAWPLISANPSADGRFDFTQCFPGDLRCDQIANHGPKRVIFSTGQPSRSPRFADSLMARCFTNRLAVMVATRIMRDSTRAPADNAGALRRDSSDDYLNGSPVRPGGWLTSKPTWWNTSGCSATSAFFMTVGGSSPSRSLGCLRWVLI